MSAVMDGLKELDRAMTLLPSDVEALMRPPIARAAQGTKDDARTMVPKIEHDLENSIDVVISNDGLRADIGSRGIKYAAWVEFGTSDTRPKPYMYPAFRKNIRGLRRELRAAAAQVGLKLRSRVKRHAKTRVK